jgi:integrase
VFFLTADEVDALLAAPDASRWEGRRDHALIALAVHTGLRLSELIGPNNSDVQLDTGAHVRCTGKGRKQRDRGLKKIGSGRVADAFIRRPGVLTATVDPSRWGSRLVSGCRGRTRTRTRQEPTDELRQRDRGAGGSRWRDTSQNCSPRGRLAIATDLPM